MAGSNEALRYVSYPTQVRLVRVRVRVSYPTQVRLSPAAAFDSRRRRAATRYPLL